MGLNDRVPRADNAGPGACCLTGAGRDTESGQRPRAGFRQRIMFGLRGPSRLPYRLGFTTVDLSSYAFSPGMLIAPLLLLEWLPRNGSLRAVQNLDLLAKRITGLQTEEAGP